MSVAYLLPVWKGPYGSPVDSLHCMTVNVSDFLLGVDKTIISFLDISMACPLSLSN